MRVYHVYDENDLLLVRFWSSYKETPSTLRKKGTLVLSPILKLATIIKGWKRVCNSDFQITESIDFYDACVSSRRTSPSGGSCIEFNDHEGSSYFRCISLSPSVFLILDGLRNTYALVK